MSLGANDALDPCLAPTKHPLAISPSSGLTVLSQPSKGSDGGGVPFLPTSPQRGKPNQGEGPEVLAAEASRPPEVLPLCPWWGSSYFTPEMLRPALPSLRATPAAARVTEARLSWG